MPTYEYACEACGNSWEAEQRITEPALKDCPKCGKPEARRLISGSRFMLKGSGWYADGYGNSKPAASEAKPASDAKPSSGSTD
jgi:putative FmdB family regulatory protein